jgi:aspartyl aminopeptidase
MVMPVSLDRARALLDYIDRSPTPYHAVSAVAERLETAGFRRLDEREEWRLEPGECAYLVRGGGSLVAWRLGCSDPAEAGFVLVGAHTDSPNLRVKPNPESTSAGWLQLGVEVYGSPLFHSWLDRDLGLAGRVVLAHGQTELVRWDQPLLRIPSLAVHLERGVNQKGLVLDPQKHLVPLLGRAGASRGFRPMLTEALMSQGLSEAESSSVESFDLCLYDVQPGALGGADSELILGSRLDNLTSCHCAVSALLQAAPRATTQVVLLVDHEEVGSQSMQGAKSRFVLGVLERILVAARSAGGQSLGRALARSLLVSADMAHAVHPGHVEKYDPEHLVMLGQGPVIKLNAAQAYATDAPAHATFARACAAREVAVQRFVSRNDLRCGSTIGPISASRLGIRTVDVGCPMLAMHSCREMSGAADVGSMILALTELLGNTPLPPPDA